MAVFASSQREAQAETQQLCVFGMARGENARLNVVNAAVADVCVVQLGFLEPDGTEAKQSRATLTPGQSVFLDFARSAQGTNRPLRKRFRAVANKISGASCIATLEIFDNTTGMIEVLIGTFEQR